MRGQVAMVAMTDIESFASRIVHEFRPEKVILFGSHAAGTAERDSDVDLLIVLRHIGKSWQTATQIRNRLTPPFPVDLLVRSPQQLQARLNMGDPFMREVLACGRVLYETHHG